jgi:hypothetical protein
MKSGKWVAMAAISVPLLAHSVSTTMEVVALRERLTALEASQEKLVRFTHDFGMNLLRDARFSGAFDREMVLRTVLLQRLQEDRPVSFSALNLMRQNAMPETLHEAAHKQ